MLVLTKFDWSVGGQYSPILPYGYCLIAWFLSVQSTSCLLLHYKLVQFCNFTSFTYCFHKAGEAETNVD